MRAKMGLCLVVAVCACAAPAPAHQSLGGPTGLVALPTADALGVGKAEAAVDYARADDGHVAPLRVAAGLGHGWEVFGLWADASGGNITGYGAKAPLTRLPIVGLAIAGGAGLYRQRDGADVRALYVVGTQELPRARLHLGMMQLRVDDADFSEEAMRPFAGVEVALGGGRTLVVEGRKRWAAIDARDLVSAALRFPLRRDAVAGIVKSTVNAEVGVSNGALMGQAGDNTNVFFGLQYGLGVGP